MLIRKAKPQDCSAIAPLIFLAMEDIVYAFIGESYKNKAINFLEQLIAEEQNQYSYENCWVLTAHEEIIAVACVYDGAKLYELRKPVGDKIKRLFNRDFNPEDETQAGEFYIDCVGVDPKMQGQGLGSKMFAFLIDEYVYKRNKTLGLLVDKENPNAKKLYLKLGFTIVGEKTLAKKSLEHLQLKSGIK